MTRIEYRIVIERLEAEEAEELSKQLQNIAESLGVFAEVTDIQTYNNN